MQYFRAVPVLLLLTSVWVLAGAAPRDVALAASDGTLLKATYYAAEKPGPAVLLLHMCNTTRKSWEPLGPQLAAAGIHALAIDYRGFGESGGERFDPVRPQDAQRTVNDKWPGDIDSRLRVPPGATWRGQDAHRRRRRQLRRDPGGARRRSAIPRSDRWCCSPGRLDPDGADLHHRDAVAADLRGGAADDQYDDNAPELMQWILAMSGNPRNTFSGFKDGKHGTEIFGPHPELPKQIVAWYADTLVKQPADPKRAGDGEEHADARLLAEGRVSRRRRRGRADYSTTTASAIRTRSCFRRPPSTCSATSFCRPAGPGRPSSSSS